MMRIRSISFFALALTLAAGDARTADQPAVAPAPYEFGVFPHLSLTSLRNFYAPIAADFEAKLGRRVRLSSKVEYAAFEEELQKQTYDIAFIQPFDYVDAHDRYGYLPLARRGEDLEAVIVVRRDSALQSIKDLQGKTLASPPPGAAVTRLAAVALRQAGIDPATGVKVDYVRNHSNCMQSVLIGVADACSTAAQAFLHFGKEEQMASRLRVLHKTASIPHALFVVHSRVGAKDREILRRTILEWPKTAEGRKLIEAAHFIPFIAATDAQYDAVRRFMQTGK